MKTLAFLAVGCLLFSISVEAQPGYPKLPAPDPIPIHAWIGPPAAETTLARYRELSNAGFNHSFSGFPNNDEMEKALDIAQKCGVKLFIQTPELRKDTEGTVKRFRSHPAIAGYHLQDEPNVMYFAELSALVKKIRALDDDHFCYINLYPNYASDKQLGTAGYQKHVDKFIAEIPVQVISFDHYPVVGDKLRPQWYKNLEIISKAAQKAGKPFWAFSLAVAHDPYPIPTPAHLRVQVYSNLAYGAQGIQYFTYWTPQSSTWNFHQAPITKDGKRSVVYNRVKELNEELQARAGVFMGSKVNYVQHIGEKIPEGTTRYSLNSPFHEFKIFGEGAVVSELVKGKQRFIIVVNRDINNPMKLTVGVDVLRGVKRIQKDGSMRILPLYQNKFTVDPGDAMIFMWEKI